MYAIFKENGEIDEVIIPPKRDKRGKRFGFVRFFNVADERLMVIKLDNIIIGTKKIHANLPRFNRDSGRRLDKGKEQLGHEIKGVSAGNTEQKGGNNQRTYGGNAKTYARVVNNNQPKRRRVDVLE
ncbi:unnamed protein product [Vicia faba]|uniref:RRM domain-containing protein n=1 Tax=Vicia faba TaxID=3906 RepID=A0AAV1AY94_VICFA|nr:unnamed protein product [Vicia faba]